MSVAIGKRQSVTFPVRKVKWRLSKMPQVTWLWGMGFRGLAVSATAFGWNVLAFSVAWQVLKCLEYDYWECFSVFRSLSYLPYFQNNSWSYIGSTGISMSFLNCKHMVSDPHKILRMCLAFTHMPKEIERARERESMVHITPSLFAVTLIQWKTATG